MVETLDAPNTAVEPAAPSAVETPTTQTPVAETPVTEAAEVETVALSDLTAAQRLEWRKTGILPVKPVSAAAPVEKPAAETRPAPEAEVKPDRRPHKVPAGARIAELLREKRQLAEQLAALQKQQDVKAEPSTAPKPVAAAIVAADPDELRVDDFQTLGDYAKAVSARLKKVEASAKEAVAAAIKADREERQRESEQAALSAKEQTHVDEMRPKFLDGIKRHADFREAVAPFWDKEIQLPEAVTDYIFDKDTKYGQEILYKLGADYLEGGDLQARLSAMALHRQIAFVADMHRGIETDLDKPKPTTTVPRIGKTPANLAAQSSAPEDDDALLARDPVAHRKLMNQRQLQRERERRAQLG